MRGGELLDEGEGVVGGTDASVVVVEHGQDLVRVSGVYGLCGWPCPFKVLTAPGPDVEIWICVG